MVGRYDCPSVRRNEGAPYEDEVPNLRRFAGQIELADGFDVATCCGLSREQIAAVCEFAATMIGGFERDAQQALFIFSLANLLEMTDVGEVNREGLGQILGGLRKLVIDATSRPAAKPGALARLSFRSLLGQYLRRDEDVLDKRAGRFGRAVAMMKIVLGFGCFRELGLSHRPGKIKRAKLFEPALAMQDSATFSLFWRMIRNKLDSFQFMGAANGGRNFFEGFRSLALLYPLTLAVAKYNAGNRGATRVEAEDVDQAVATIEHSFGRLATLNQPHARSLERALLEPGTFTRLVTTI